MDIFKNFIKENKDNILGQEVESTDRFGKAITIIKGTLENILQIDAPSSSIPTKSKEVAEVETEQISSDRADGNLESSIEITKEEIKKKKVIRRKRKKTPIFIDGDKEQEIYTFEESDAILNKGITKEEKQVWLWYQKKRGLKLNEYTSKIAIENPNNNWLKEQLKKGIIAFDTETMDYIPSVLYFAGNIYDKLSSLRAKESYFEENNIYFAYENQLEQLNSILPTPLKLIGKQDERLVLSVLSKFVKNNKIVYNEEEQSIIDAFKTYLKTFDRADLKYDVNPYDIVNYYINGNRMPRYYDKVEKVKIKRNAALECVDKMSYFLAEEINEESRKQIEVSWNREYNSIVNIAYDKIPLFIQYSKYFKNGELQIRDAQREAVSFQQANGTGIIAYGVGLGKTMAAILNLGYAMQNGICERPLIVVPKPTYDKWIGEINGVYEDGKLIASGILPQYNIISLRNLNKKIQSELLDGKGGFKKEIPKDTIIISTYEALTNIGFGEEEEGSFIMKLKEILNQGFANESERQEALENEKLNKMLGIGQENGVLDIDKTGFDYLTIDEAHNFNKIFGSVKGETNDYNNRDKNNYTIKGSISSRSIKAFFISNYIQNQTILGNICLLTATPFTNNPIEVYNMLALTNIERLKYNGIVSMTTFFDNYVNQTYENVVKSTGKIEESAVIKGWSNKVSLQKLLFNYMNYKNGEDVGILRPEKWTLPKLSENINGEVIQLPFSKQIQTYLKSTVKQKENQKEISRWLLAQLKDPILSKKAPYLVADIMSKKNTISPYVYENENPSMIDPKSFIESSPKLRYTMEAIKSIRDWHNKKQTNHSSQVIYINGGIDYLPIIKEYMMQELGYERDIYSLTSSKGLDEVEILAGSGTYKRSVEEKEIIKDLFNKGLIKIIIGTSTIREGIDLQVNSSCLFSLWVDWNPTAYSQLEGRVWRYGNKYKNIRIATPLLVGSSDAFTYQKLEEKTGRINDIFDRNDKSNLLDVGVEDREAVKWALVDDLSEIAKAKIRAENEKIKKEISIFKHNKNELDLIDDYKDTMSNFVDKIKPIVDLYFQFVKTKKEGLTDLEKYQILARQRDNVYNLLEEENRNYYGFNREMSDLSWRYGNYKDRKKKLEKITGQISKKFGTNELNNENILKIKNELNEKIEVSQKRMSTINSDEYLDKLVKEIEFERNKFNSGIKSYEDTIKQFKDLNYLLDEYQKVEQQITKTKPIIENNNNNEISNSDNLNKRLRLLERMIKKVDAKKKKNLSLRKKLLSRMIAKSKGTPKMAKGGVIQMRHDIPDTIYWFLYKHDRSLIDTAVEIEKLKNDDGSIYYLLTSKQGGLLMVSKETEDKDEIRTFDWIDSKFYPTAESVKNGTSFDVIGLDKRRVLVYGNGGEIEKTVKE